LAFITGSKNGKRDVIIAQDTAVDHLFGMEEYPFRKSPWQRDTTEENKELISCIK